MGLGGETWQRICLALRQLLSPQIAGKAEAGIRAAAALRLGMTFLLKKKKNKPVFLRHPFRCWEADVPLFLMRLKTTTAAVAGSRLRWLLSPVSL